MDELTDRQKDAYEVIAGFYDEYGLGPTQTHVGEVLGVSRNTASLHVRALIAKRWVTHDELRGYVPADAGRDA